MRHCPICLASYDTEVATCPTDGARLVASGDWAPGAVIRNKYRILDKIGQGGMGVVYKAEHLALEELRALKVMSAALGRDQKFLHRFREEARAARRLRHPNIVQVDDLDQAEDGSLFIVMEYVEGVTLRRLLQTHSGPLALDRAFRIARNVAGALAIAHESGVIHRDIKPDNILLTQDAAGDDVAKVTDFGIAALKQTSSMTSSTLLMTPAYTAPEQWRGLKSSELDGRVDLYALGITLYEMIAGRRPFAGETPEQWVYAHLTQEPRPPSQLNPEIAAIPGLDELVLRMLAKSRDDRPPNAQAFLDALDFLSARAGTGGGPPELPETIIERPRPYATTPAPAKIAQADLPPPESPQPISYSHYRMRRPERSFDARKVRRIVLAGSLAALTLVLAAYVSRTWVRSPQDAFPAVGPMTPELVGTPLPQTFELLPAPPPPTTFALDSGDDVSVPPTDEAGQIPGTSVAGLLASARAALEGGNYDRAIEIYQRLLELDPANRDARQGLKQTLRAREAERKVLRGARPPG